MNEKLNYNPLPGELLEVNSDKRRKARRSRRIAFSLMVLILGISPLWCWHSMEPTVGRSQALSQCPVKGLPLSATNISYCLKDMFGPADYYEFDVPESDFLTWAQTNGWPPKGVTTPTTFYRFGMSSMTPGDPRQIEITAGYDYRWIDPAASDDTLSIGYDLVLHRAFYDRSYR